MPRQPRIDIPGLLQHVIFRGVARGDIFIDEDNRQDFVRRLSLLLAETNTQCYAWVLLDNHVVATRLCRFKGAEVGERLAYSTTAVSRAALRGKSLYEQDGDFKAFLYGEM